MTPKITRRTCRLFTGAWVRSGEREVWSGPRSDTKVACGYSGGPHTLLCHLIATHGIALESARATLAMWEWETNPAEKELVP